VNYVKNLVYLILQNHVFLRYLLYVCGAYPRQRLSPTDYHCDRVASWKEGINIQQ